MKEEAAHRRAVRHAVRTAVQSGITDLGDVLQLCEGADPVLVSSMLVEARKKKTRKEPPASIPDYELLSTLPFQLPAPDPSRSQWWFSSSALAHLLSIVETRIGQIGTNNVLCLGTPSLAPHLAHRRVTVLDIDEQVLDVIAPFVGRARVRAYDAADKLPRSLVGKFQIVVLDPPWYRAAIYTFIDRALSALIKGGEVICAFPGRLTRPGIETLRADLMRDVVAAGHEILAVERGVITYQVPRFERAALEHLGGFRSMPWRAADLLHIRKGRSGAIPVTSLEKKPWYVFARRPTEFRIFSGGTAQLHKGTIAKELKKYSSNISTRAHVGQNPDVWSSEKTGLQVGDIASIHIVLNAWQSGLDQAATIDQLIALGRSRTLATQITRALDSTFSLWSKFAAERPLRSSREIEEIRVKGLSPWHTPPSQREHAEDSDRFRGSYQRDRDRVLWSSGLRRLSNKTQLFPVEHDDDLRHRLAHSVEVYQLASTIGASFGLDGALIEAGALAHDIGHTPFGHAGEHALDKLFNTVSSRLGGFNHYEHGVDVIRYLEGPYHVSSVSSFAGLNLTPEVCECVLKHTYCHTGHQFGSDELYRRSKHQGFIRGGYCHLEGQAVRAADKISYLISDLEDGIRLGALSRSDLLRCNFFHRPPLEFSRSSERSLVTQFLEQRRMILKILMEDIIQASNKRLARMGVASTEKVRNATEYAIQHSDELLADIKEIWDKLQSGRLHKDRRVASANLRAARVVTELTIAYTVMPELVEERFRVEYERLRNSKYMRFYKERSEKELGFRSELVSFMRMHAMIGRNYEVGRDISFKVEDFVMAKDYVAALTDSRARLLHDQLFEGLA